MKKNKLSITEQMNPDCCMTDEQVYQESTGDNYD